MLCLIILEWFIIHYKGLQVTVYLISSCFVNQIFHNLAEVNEQSFKEGACLVHFCAIEIYENNSLWSCQNSGDVLNYIYPGH